MSQTVEAHGREEEIVVSQTPGPVGKAWAWGVQRRETVRANAVLIAIVVVGGYLSFTTDAFLTETNLVNVVRQSSMVGIIACGMTFVLISGQLDLSVGAIAAFAGVVAMDLSNAGHIALGIAVALCLGVGLGLLNGLLTTRLFIHSFIVTLATAVAIRGLVFSYTDSSVVYGDAEGFKFLGQGDIGPIPVPIALLGVIVGASWLILKRTVIGRHVYAIGGNAEAARLAGINVSRYRVLVFAFSGFCAALAGVILASRVYSGVPGAATGWELDVIAAVVIGGTSILGGAGGIGSTVIGVMFLGVLTNGFNLLGVSVNTQQVLLGAIIILAVGADSLSRRRRTERS